jgi:colanic acid biosynthesis glycosyl transferase WcaI
MVWLGLSNAGSFLTQYYAPEIGAPQIRLRAVARMLRRHRLTVEVLTALPNCPAGKIFPGYGGRYHVREEKGRHGRPAHVSLCGPGRSASVRLANYLSVACTALIASLTGPRPDVMFYESQPLSLGVVALLMKWLRGQDIIVAHGRLG